MTELKGAKPRHVPGQSISKDLSRPASAASESGTLQEDLPPSYDDHDDFQASRDSARSIPNPASGSISQSAPQAGTIAPQSRPQPNPQQRLDPSEVGPTISEPFHFPTNEVPSYAAFDPVRRPLAIPQLQPQASSPFLSAYPTCLLSFGIPDESWRSFVDTLSAFLNAAVGAQAVQHAADLAWTLGEAHKDWAIGQKGNVMELGRKAQRGDLFGVIGSTLGLTLGTAGHIVDSVLKFPARLVKKPQTPRERADAYVAAANKDWLNARGLHARIVDTSQLADVADTSEDVFTKSAKKTKSVGEQFNSLYQFIAEMEIGDGSKDLRAKGEKALLPITATPPLDITRKTLWLTLLKLDEEEMELARQT